MCGRDEDPRGEDGGRTHEVGLATRLSEEQGSQPGEAAISRGRGSFTVLVRPDYAASPGALVGSEECGIYYKLCERKLTFYRQK